MAGKASKSVRESEKQEAIERLREWLKPGDTVYTILRHVSRSGMQRTISVIQLPCNAEQRVRDLSYNVALACGYSMDRDREGVKVNGTGSDMGFEVVYYLGRTLWPDGFGCVGERCRSNEHSNGDRDYTPHCVGLDKDGTLIQPVVGCPLDDECKGAHWHRDGGYALAQR